MESTRVECVFIDEHKATDGMKESLSRLVDLLKCRLCNQLFDQPTTLSSCAHTFCVSCIDEYSCDAWVCPVEGCRMPMSIVGGHGGSYRKINPQLAQTVESLKIICKKLNECDNGWWKTVSKEYTIKKDEDGYYDHEESPLDSDFQDTNDSDGEMIDLQAGIQSSPQEYVSDDEEV